MKKHLLWLCALLLAACGLMFSAGAAETRVYVADGGTGDGKSASAPCGSLAAAVDALNGAGGTVVFVGDVTVSAQTTLPEQSGDLTFTAEGGARLVQKQRITFAKNTNDNVITFDLPVYAAASSPVAVFGSFNSITFTEKFAVTKAAAGSGFWFYGGVYTAEAAKGGVNADYITELPYAITVKNGTFDRFSGGNLRPDGHCLVGAIAAPLTITIEGGTFGATGTYDVESNNQQYNGFSVSGQMILADDATLNISGGTFHVPVFMQGRVGLVAVRASRDSTLTASDKKYYSIDGDLKINISGGSFDGGMISAYQQQVSHAQVVRGNFDVTITGTPTFKAGTVLDATAVKPYAGGSTKATLTMPAAQSGVTVRRFDEVNGAAQSYTEPLRIVTIGDSITEGYGASFATQSYPARIAARLMEEGKDTLIANYGLSSGGMTMGKAARVYYPDSLADRLTRTETGADRYVFALGTNDADAAGYSNGSEKWYVDLYTDFIKTVGDNPETSKVYITNAVHRMTPNVATLRTSSLIRPTQKKIADTLNAADPGKYAFIDLYALTYEGTKAGTFLSTDNIHPTVNGYIYMAEKVYDAIFNGVTEVEGFRLTDVYASDSGTPFGAGTKDDPISYLPNAIDRLATNADVTLHIVGTLTFSGDSVSLPTYMQSLTIVGEGADAVLNISKAADVRLGCPTVFRNLTVNGRGASTALVCRYFDLDIDESVTLTGKWDLILGNIVQSDRSKIDVKTNMKFDSAESVSSDRDCTVRVLTGTWTRFFCGDRRISNHAPIGTYGGHMTVTVGGAAKITGMTTAATQATLYAAVSGMNYLTGSIDATVDGWESALALADFAYIGARSDIVPYTPSKNTGIVRLTTAAKTIRMGDLDGDGAVTVRDALLLVRASVNGGLDEAQAERYFHTTAVTLTDVIRLLERTAQN